MATMEDEIVMHGYDNPEPEAPRGWEVGDTACYFGESDGCHIYVGGSAHQAEMNGETE